MENATNFTKENENIAKDLVKDIENFIEYDIIKEYYWEKVDVNIHYAELAMKLLQNGWHK